MDSSEDEAEGKLGSGRASPTAKRKLSGAVLPSGRLTPDIMDRQGFLLRTESRERFDRIGGRKSRQGSLSPTRRDR